MCELILLFVACSVEHWDHQLFGVNECEASRMDPQHKLALEVSYRTLEDAGLTLADVRHTDTAVYMGEWAEARTSA